MPPTVVNAPPVGRVIAGTESTDEQLKEDRREQYLSYIDAIYSGAISTFASADLDTPLSLAVSMTNTTVRTRAARGGEGVAARARAHTHTHTRLPHPQQGRTRLTFLAKARAVLTKAPGFFGFSSYRSFAWRAPLLLPMSRVAEITTTVFQASDLAADGRLVADAGDGAVAANFTASTLPKARVLVKNTAGLDVNARAAVVNGLRSIINDDRVTVTDVQDVLSSADLAATALEIFFTVVAGLAMALCFFAAWLSFSANIRENARDFGILRAVGLSVRQVLVCFLIEALAVVIAAFLLGTVVGG